MLTSELDFCCILLTPILGAFMVGYEDRLTFWLEVVLNTVKVEVVGVVVVVVVGVVVVVMVVVVVVGGGGGDDGDCSNVWW